MLARTHIIKLQRALYDKLRAHARHYLGSLSSELAAYYREYQKDFRRFDSISSKHKLLREILTSDVVICGDYHSLAQAQRTVIRLLRDTVRILERQNRSVVLLLEMLRPEDDKKVARYLEGKITEAQFLKQIGFKKNWGFSWNNYAPLFQYARQNGIQIRGINRPELSLRGRDKFTAEVAAKITEEFPKAFLFILVGDLHVGFQHLPRELNLALDRLGLQRELLLIHQNNESLYWKLVEGGLEQFAEVVKLKRKAFCVMNTPPWIKLKSHLKWVEMVSEGPSSADQVWDEEHHHALEEYDHTEEIEELLVILIRFLGLEKQVKGMALDDFDVRGPFDLEFLRRLEKDGIYTPSQIRFFLAALKEFESQFFFRSRTVFLTNIRLNHAAGQAALYLFQKLARFDGVFEIVSRDFYPFVWVEALSFLGSRIVNPKRKCNGPADLRRLTRPGSVKKTQNERAAEMALEHLAYEKSLFSRTHKKPRYPLPKSKVSQAKTLLYYKVSKLLGQLLGYAIYEGIVQGRVSVREVRELFLKPMGNAETLYLQWAEKLDKHLYREIVKREKL